MFVMVNTEHQVKNESHISHHIIHSVTRTRKRGGGGANYIMKQNTSTLFAERGREKESQEERDSF